MLNKNKIATVVEKFLGGTDKFLVEVEVSSGNVVDVYVDGDEGVSISECVKVSRLIESSFDRDLEDYELRVSSPGLTRPFKLRRQYAKYINRGIKVVLENGEELKGNLLEFNDDKLILECFPKGKKKNAEKLVKDIEFSEIKEAKPVISFK